MNQLKCGFSTEIKTLAIGFKNSESLFRDCLDLIPKMPLDTSYSAKTRRRLWLNHEVHLRTGEISVGYQHDSIWNFCQKVYPGCDVGLISYGGSVDGIDSSGLIGWHRDHSYAMPKAIGINLGEAVFGYGELERKQYPLRNAHIFQFNCKVEHSLISIKSDLRFGIVLWKLNQEKGYQPII